MLLFSFGFSADRLAVTTKKQGQVDVTRAETATKEELKKGSILSDNDLITTGKDGAALILFLDDKSQLKLKGNTEVVITGSRSRSGISKRISMEQGVIKASIATQRKGEFIIATPTSVASVKGTEFWVISTADSGDVIISNNGTIELVNTVTGEVITVPAGVIVESTPDGQMNILETIKISGTASSELSGDQFSMMNIQLIEGGVDLSTISGTISVTDNTVVEGGAVAVGSQVTVRGAFDSQTGNTVATLVEVASPLQIEATATGLVSEGQFSVGDVVIIDGDADTPPTAVGITASTATQGGDVVVGATVTVTGYHNEETGVIEASTLTVAAPPPPNAITVQGIALSTIQNNQFTVGEISVTDGDVDAGAISGTILTTSETEISGGAVDSGFTVIVTGVYDDSSQAVTAQVITVIALELNQVLVTITGTASSVITNNQFTLADITVDDGDVDEAGISGTIAVTDSTALSCEVVTGGVLTITGIYDENTQVVVAVSVDCVVEEVFQLLISGTAVSSVSNDQFGLGEIVVIEGDVSAADISGSIILPDDFSPGTCEILPGALITVAGVYDDSTQNISATAVTVLEIIVEGEVSADLSNNQFTLNISSVFTEGLEASSLSGEVKVEDDTEFLPAALGLGGIVTPAELRVEGCRIDPVTGQLIARRVSLVGEAEERELIFQLENAQGESKQLIITY